MKATTSSLVRRLALSAVALVASSAGAKDVLVYKEADPWGRTPISADPAQPGRLAIGGVASRCQSRNAVHYSDDGGLHWVPRCLPFPPESYFLIEEPSIAFGETGAMLAATSAYDGPNEGLFVARSEDDGQTWTWTELFSLEHFHARDALIPADHHPKSPYKGSVYIAHSTSSEEGQEPHVAISRDDGRSWSIAKIPALSSATGLAIDRRGRLFLNDAASLARSDDGGATWHELGLAAGGTGGALAIDTTNGPRGGTLYFASLMSTGMQNTVVLSRSEDAGVHWTEARPIATVTGDQTSLTISVGPQGEVAVAWLDQRSDPEHLRYQPWVVFSPDGGLSFGQPQPLGNDLTTPPQGGALRLSQTWSGRSLHAAFLGTGKQAQLTIRSGKTRP
ncbi:sialidase family protein [Ideonella sp.]|uniref:sialidase family protein n=1 Tax=Ideonella sp. TaxID=1929293 RepID=UPI0035B271B1